MRAADIHPGHRDVKVGLVFWKIGHRAVPGRTLRIRPAYIRHEIRGIFDGQFAFRSWSAKRGWVYAIEPIFMWDEWTTGPRPILFSAAEARAATAKRKRRA